MKQTVYKNSKTSPQHKKSNLTFILFAFIILTLCPINKIIKAQDITIDDLPFKNNHERNLLYASRLYDTDEREEALDVYYNMIAAYQAAGEKEKEADVHEKLGYLYYEKDKQWGAEERSVEEQQTWIRSNNMKAVSELTEFLRCYAGSDLTKHPNDDSRYDRNFIQIITCFEENQAWAMALEWMNKYESFRNPESTVYNDKIDLIQFIKAEYYSALRSLPEALELYRQVAYGFDAEEQSKYAPKALQKYKDLEKRLRPEIYKQLISKAQTREADNDWEEALCTLIYAQKYAFDSEAHKQLIDDFKERRKAMLTRQLVTVNMALEKQQWTDASTALLGCMKVAGDRPELYSLYRACQLAEKGEKLAAELRYVAAADMLHEAVGLAGNKTPFLKRANELEAEASRDIDAQLTQAQNLIDQGGLENVSSAFQIISQILAVRPQHQETLLLKDKMLGKPVSLDIGNGTLMEFVVIPSGTFLMGSHKNEEGRDQNEGIQRDITLTKPFWMATTEVTQEQYGSLMSRNFSENQNIQNAAVVSWNDAVLFCQKLSDKTGFHVHLPSEAEWEYACRAGTTTRFSFGDDDKKLGEYAWFRSNAYDANEQYAHAVARKKPNPWGLYDMHGNLWEWCNDWYSENNTNSEPLEDPQGPSSGEYRVLRGGSWFSASKHCRSASRYWLSSDDKENIVGFRVVLELK